MDYSQIAETLSNKREELSNKRISLESIISKLESYKNKINSSEEERLRVIKVSEERERKIAIEDGTSLLNDKITELNGTLEELNEEKNQKLEEINYESLRDKFKDEFPVDEYLDKCKELNSKLETKIGKSFMYRVSKHVPSVNSRFNTIEEISEAFSEIDLNLNKMSEDESFLDRVDEFLFPVDDEESNNNEKEEKFRDYATITFSIIMLLSLVFFPITMIPLILMLTLNIIKSIKFYKCISLLNSIVPNIDKIKESIDSNIELTMEREKNKVNSLFSEKIGDVENKITNLNNKIASKIEEINYSFVFNPQTVNERFNSESHEINKLIEITKEQKDRESNLISNLVKEIAELEDELIISISQLKNKYYQLEPKDVKNLDINIPKDVLIEIPLDEDSDPEFFNLEEPPFLITYDDLNQCYDFANLILYSIYCNVNPKFFNVNLIEKKDMASNFLEFDKFNNFNILDNKEQENNFFTDVYQETIRRRSLVGNNVFRNINNDLVNNGSTPHASRIIVEFCNEPYSLSENKKNILRNGYKYGVYYFIFIEEESLINKAEKVDNLREDLVTIKSLKRGKLTKTKFSSFYEK